MRDEIAGMTSDVVRSWREYEISKKHRVNRSVKQTNGQTDRQTVGKILGQKDDEERRDEIVDALNVAAGRVTYRPDVEDTFKHLRINTPQQREY